MSVHDIDAALYGVYEGIGATIPLPSWASDPAPSPRTATTGTRTPAPAPQSIPLPSFATQPAPSRAVTTLPSSAPRPTFVIPGGGGSAFVLPGGGRAAPPAMKGLITPKVLDCIKKKQASLKRALTKRELTGCGLPAAGIRQPAAARSKVVTSKAKLVATLPKTLPKATADKVLNMATLYGVPVIGGSPEIGFEEIDGLWFVAKAAQPVVQQLMGAMSLFVDAGQDSKAESFTATAAFMAGQVTGDAWAKVQAAIASGYAVMVDKKSIATTGAAALYFTQSPSVVVQKASGKSAAYALVVDAPEGVIGSAEQMAQAGVVPPKDAPVVAPPADDTSVAPPPEDSGLPSWVLPAILGAGIVAAAVIVLKK